MCLCPSYRNDLMKQGVNHTVKGYLHPTKHPWMLLMRAPRLLKLTHTRLDQGLGALPLQCLSVEKTCPVRQCHPLYLVMSLVESRFLIADTFKILIGTSTLMSVDSPLLIAHHVSQTTPVPMLQPHQPRVFVETPSSDLVPISRTTWPILSHSRQN